MPLNEVSTKTRIHSQRSLEIHATLDRQEAERGDSRGFRTDVGAKTRRIQLRDGQADAIHRHAFASAQLRGEVGCDPDAISRLVRRALGEPAYSFNDAREHRLRSRYRARAARRRRRSMQRGEWHRRSTTELRTAPACAV